MFFFFFWGGGLYVKISFFCENHEFYGISTNNRKLQRITPFYVRIILLSKINIIYKLKTVKYFINASYFKIKKKTFFWKIKKKYFLKFPNFDQKNFFPATFFLLTFMSRHESKSVQIVAKMIKRHLLWIFLV